MARQVCIHTIAHQYGQLVFRSRAPKVNEIRVVQPSADVYVFEELVRQKIFLNPDGFPPCKPVG